jgi:hypothetical protein
MRRQGSWMMVILRGIAALLALAVLPLPSFGSLYFEGLLSATPTGPDTINLKWDFAQEDQNSIGPISYLIYQTTQSGELDYDHPSYTTKDTFYQVTGLASNTTYYFVVRAKEQNGQFDANRIERSAATFGRWVKKTPATAPSPRLAHGMVYDNQSGHIILFGGQNEKGPMNDMWMYDPVNNTWSQQHPVTALLPSPRTARSLVYAEGLLILVGGITSSTPRIKDHNTWIYNLSKNTWTAGPPIPDSSGYGFHPEFVYDSANRVVVLLSGREDTSNNEKTVVSQTWKFDVTQNTWTRVFPATSPSPSHHPFLVFDSVNKKVILFGGEHYTTRPRFNDTWTYDVSSNIWTQIFPATNPSPRAFHEMVYDSHNQQVILFGGFLFRQAQPLTNETWVYNIRANTWIQVKNPNTPSPRFHHAMVYDPISKKVILFGGGTVMCREPGCHITTGFVNDTWVYE